MTLTTFTHAAPSPLINCGQSPARKYSAHRLLPLRHVPRQRERHGVEKDGDKQNAKREFIARNALCRATSIDFSRER